MMDRAMESQKLLLQTSILDVYEYFSYTYGFNGFDLWSRLPFSCIIEEAI